MQRSNSTGKGQDKSPAWIDSYTRTINPETTPYAKLRYLIFVVIIFQ